jgi:hypothetical protein
MPNTIFVTKRLVIGQPMNGHRAILICSPSPPQAVSFLGVRSWMVFGYRTGYPSLRFKLTEGLKWNYEKIVLSFTLWPPFFHALFSPIWHRHTLLVRTHGWCARERTQNARVHTTSTPPATTAIARASERELMDCGADGDSGLFVYVWAVKIWLHLQVATPAAWRLCLSRRQWWVCVGISDAVRLDGESEFVLWDLGCFCFFPGCVGVFCLSWGFWFWEALRQISLSTYTLERVFRVSAQ